MASFTSRRALVYLYFSGLPIDLRVVVLEPGIIEDHVLLSKAGDSEERPFRVGFVAEDYVYNFGDLACLVGGTVHVVHWYGVRDAPSVNIFRTDKVSIYEVACSSGVQKRLDGVCQGTTQRQLLLKLGKSPRSLVEIQVRCIYHSLLVYIAYTRQSHALSHGHMDQ